MARVEYIKADITLEINAYFQKRLKVNRAILKSQAQIVSLRVRHSVTTSLYLNPKQRARSLSKLMAVNVNNDTPLKVVPAMSLMLKTL